MATAQSINSVQRLYLAYYGRPADPAGLNFWATRLDAANGSLSGMIDAFATSAESQALFGSKSAGDQIKFIFQSAFGRSISDSDEGFVFYSSKLAQGAKLQNLALDILNGAKGQDLALLQNRENAAAKFTAALDLPNEQAAYSGAVKAQIVRDEVSKILASADSLNTFNNGVDALVQKLVGLDGQLIQGKVTAGPVVPGNGLSVTAYDAQGNALGSGSINPDGSYSFSITNGYTGPVLVRVVDANTGPDYIDEARGSAVDLTSDLRALTTVTGNGVFTVNINPITELIARRVGLQGGDAATSQLVLGNTSPEQIQRAT